MYKQLTIQGKFGVIIFAILGSIFSAHVAQYLWLWFLVPIVEVEPITLLQSMGLMILVSFMTKEIRADDSEDVEMYIANIILQCALIPAWALFVGWIIHSIM